MAYGARMAADEPISLSLERLRRRFAQLREEYVAAGLEDVWEAEAARFDIDPEDGPLQAEG